MKVSFCTTCMGRTHHLKQTLYKNIADNADADVEFVILDYNSKDDLAEWIGREMRREMEEGRVTFWQEKTAKFFHHSHAKNVAALLARGEIICNLDADNFTGPGYAKYLIDAIENDGRTVIYHAIADGRRGRITMSKESFIKLRGYDESLQGYGYEDLDIMNRAMANGLRLLPATLQKGGVIKHRSWERAQNMTNKNIHKTNLNNMEKCWSRCPWEIINPNGFGKATVYENFSAEPIEVGYKKNSIPTQNVPVSAIILYVGDRRLPAERKTIPSVMRNFPRETTMVKWDGAITMQALKTHIRRSMQPYILTCLGGTIFMPGSLHKMVAALEANPKEIYAYPTIRYIGCEPPHIPVAVLIRREACMNMSDGSKMNGVTVDEAVVEFLGL